MTVPLSGALVAGMGFDLYATARAGRGGGFRLPSFTGASTPRFEPPSGPQFNGLSPNRTAVIGRMPDLQKPGAIRAGEYTIADRLPYLGNPKADYYQNMSVLRREMRRGEPIRDASSFRPDTDLAPTPLWPDRTIRQSFTGAERNQLTNRGWTRDSELWIPPR